MRKFRYVLPGLVAAIALIGCSDSTTTEITQIPDDLCVRLGTVCNDATGQISCDPVDGQCKCGGQYGNGIACGAGEVCEVDTAVSPPSPSCVSVMCDGIVCGRYETCDVLDGECKCGGVKCGHGFTCVEGVCENSTLCDGVTCRDGESCDAGDGTCKCGEDICSVGESCRTGDDGVSYCVGRQCVGNNCPAGTECSPVDGLCHCGGASGPTCSAGQACLIDDEGAGTCSGTDICAGVVCHGGTTCSPLDGMCRCGGFTTADPICGADQTCDQTLGLCVGGDQCAGVTCAPGSNTSCDAEEGICKCGGTGGVLCGAEEGCVAGLEAPLCVTRCNPLTPNVQIDVCGQLPDGPVMGCYYSPADSIAFCTTAGGQTDGQECDFITDCSSDHHCVPTSDGGVCRPYCDTRAAAGEDGACWGEGRVCVPLSGADVVVPNLGVCMTVSA